jgi:hypothetical protein
MMVSHLSTLSWSINMSADGREFDDEEFKTKHPKLYEALLGDGKNLADQLLISSSWRLSA